MSKSGGSDSATVMRSLWRLDCVRERATREESGDYVGRADTWDVTRNGARLVLSFEPASNAFVGTVENTTEAMLCAVRVEVHLSSGTELGPTERTDLPSGEKTVVELPTGGEAVESWNAIQSYLPAPAYRTGLSTG